MPKFIVYACPLGELADQLNAYFEKSLLLCDANAAHNYMPHCTLTVFFEEKTCSIPLYTQSLKQSLYQSLQTCPHPVIKITDLVFRTDWHGLELQALGRWKPRRALGISNRKPWDRWNAYVLGI